MSSSPISSFSSEPGRDVDPFDWVADVPCQVDFVLGTATVKVRDCIEFERHSVIRLRQSAGSDIEVRVGGVPVASGEVVIVEESVGLRVNHVLPPSGPEVA